MWLELQVCFVSELVHSFWSYMYTEGGLWRERSLNSGSLVL